MNKWYRLWLVSSGTNSLDGKPVEEQRVYVAQWKYETTFYGGWRTYANSRGTWDEAYAALEQHANPAALAVRFVGTF